ncbi:MAG: YSC84-related protein [Thiobacillus sp.]|jgi:lipid-binding SYLF domain-containing protein|uniref:lipid-binding SYLF domain-containing protein n=1 Tax=Thiobacillus sp. TaxID=924 RepID=UPI002894212E|nr:YSC84-related protein [Thiobacillus sp.]MDT3706149.1 YSC84-related protein [Thiobacillus sp.]
MTSTISVQRISVTALLGTALLVLLLASPHAHAASAAEIDREVDQALVAFKKIEGANAFLGIAKGVLVFPKVYKAGIGVGGEYGEGALRIGGKTVDYYSTAAASIGFQLGAQAKSIVVLFTEASALKKFRESEGWKVGVDGSVALVDIGAGKAVDTTNIKDPVIGFIFGQKGLMYNLTLEGSKFTKLEKK